MTSHSSYVYNIHTKHNCVPCLDLGPISETSRCVYANSFERKPKSKGLLLSGISGEEKQVVTTEAGQSFTCLLVVPVLSTRSHLTLGPSQSRPLSE